MPSMLSMKYNLPPILALKSPAKTYIIQLEYVYNIEEMCSKNSIEFLPNFEFSGRRYNPTISTDKSDFLHYKDMAKIQGRLTLEKLGG